MSQISTLAREKIKERKRQEGKQLQEVHCNRSDLNKTRKRINQVMIYKFIKTLKIKKDPNSEENSQ